MYSITMTKTINYSLIIIALFTALFATTLIAHAEDTDVSVDASASVEVGASSGGTMTPEERRAAAQAKLDAMKADRSTNIEARQETRSDAQEARQENRAEIKTDIEARRDALKAKGLENATQRISFNIKRYVSLIETGADRLTRLIERIESRMATLKEHGADVSEVQVHIDVASATLVSVQANIDSIKAQVDAITVDTAKESFQAIRSTLSDTRDLLKEAAQSVRDAVQALKDAAASVSVDASASTEVSGSEQ